MAILNIKKYGDPVLRQTAESFKDGELTENFVQDMIETMQKRDGVGLAAPQVGLSKRLIVASDMKEMHVLVNPEVVAFSERTEEDSEGCLSIPGIQGNIIRPAKVVVKGLKPDGEQVEISARGLMSRVLQHEIDHLNGVLFIDRSSPDTLFVTKENGETDEDISYRKTNIEEIKSLFRKVYHTGGQNLMFDHS